MQTSPVDSRLDVGFALAQDGRRTQVRVRMQEPPLRVIRGFSNADGAAYVHFHNVSGGILAGDRLSWRIEVGPCARGQVTSTGATRVYRRRLGAAPACQSTTISIARGGLLEYLPDPLILYQDANYRQRTTVDLEDEAGFLAWDVVAPGRTGHGERFAYERLQMDLDIRSQGIPILLERALLEPQNRPLNSLARLGPYCYFGSFLAICVGPAASVWLELEAELGALAQTKSGPEILWGVSCLHRHGLIVRVASTQQRAIVAGLPEFWRIAKHRLFQSDAIPPRKTY